jgi:short-subunit dehydrogenase
MDLRLSAKMAVVTGASKGIGRAIASGLAGESCILAPVSRDGVSLPWTLASASKPLMF